MPENYVEGSTVNCVLSFQGKYLEANGQYVYLLFQNNCDIFIINN